MSHRAQRRVGRCNRAVEFRQSKFSKSATLRPSQTALPISSAHIPATSRSTPQSSFRECASTPPAAASTTRSDGIQTPQAHSRKLFAPHPSKQRRCKHPPKFCGTSNPTRAHRIPPQPPPSAPAPIHTPHKTRTGTCHNFRVGSRSNHAPRRTARSNRTTYPRTFPVPSDSSAPATPRFHFGCGCRTPEPTPPTRPSTPPQPNPTPRHRLSP